MGYRGQPLANFLHQGSIDLAELSRCQGNLSQGGVVSRMSAGQQGLWVVLMHRRNHADAVKMASFDGFKGMTGNPTGVNVSGMRRNQGKHLARQGWIIGLFDIGLNRVTELSGVGTVPGTRDG